MCAHYAASTVSRSSCKPLRIHKASRFKTGHTTFSVCSCTVYTVLPHLGMGVRLGRLQGRIGAPPYVQHCSRTVTMWSVVSGLSSAAMGCTPHPTLLCLQLSIEEPLWSFSVAAVGFRSFQHQHTNPSPMHPEVCSAESSILSALPHTILFQMAGPGCLSKCHSAKFQHVHVFARPEWD